MSNFYLETPMPTAFLKRVRLPLILPAALLTLLCCSMPPAQAQQAQASVALPDDLPDAPGYASPAVGLGQSAPAPRGTATLSGIVQDANGSLVPGAQVTLASTGHPDVRTTQADPAGHFSLEGIPPGKYKLTIVSPGLQTYLSPEIEVSAGASQELPPVTLAVASVNANVQVTATEEQVAEVQIHAEEKQRVLGIAPDFYSSYIWDAAPLDTHQKFVLASKSAFDPVSFLSIAAVAGIEQWRNIYPGYGTNAASYGKRYGASFGDEAIGRFFASAVYPSLFHQDPRYFYKGSGTKPRRALYAVTRVFVTRGNNGKPEPNYSLFLGRLTAGAIANLYHDSGDRGVGLTFENAFLNIGGHAFDNLVREFVLKRFTPKVPSFENGEASAKTP